MTKRAPDDFPDTLYDFALTPKYVEAIRSLAAMAEPEDWNYHATLTDRELPVLHSYLRYTYERLAEGRKIAVAPDKHFACFNTGLVTPNQEEIFALYEVNKIPDMDPYWHFWRFCRKGEHDLTRFPELPDMAHYFDKPSVLVLDTTKEVRVNIEHIVEDNKDRFAEPYRSMDNYAVQTFLKGAIDNAMQRVRRNYKTAIPQYYQGNVQLLLPMCLGAPSKADMALVVANYGEFYRASTCLTLDMAYNNARLLARPDRDWLQP